MTLSASHSHSGAHIAPSGPVGTAQKLGRKPMNTARKAARTRSRSSLEYGVYYAASFLIFLPVVLVNRLLPKGLRLLADDGERRSVLAEAKGMANTVVPFVFMA